MLKHEMVDIMKKKAKYAKNKNKKVIEVKKDFYRVETPFD